MRSIEFGEAPPRPSGLWAFIRTKLFSFSLILAAAFLLLVSLVLSTAMTAGGGRITGTLGLPEGVVELIVATANFLLAALIFAAIFKYVPSVFVTWQAAVAGGLFTAVLFALGRFALALYLGREAEASAYGAATSLVLLLVWVYYSAADFVSWRAVFAKLPERGCCTGEGRSAFPVARSPAPAASDDIVATVAAALGLGFLLGALAMQRPRSRSRATQPGLLQRASNLLALTRSLAR